MTSDDIQPQSHSLNILKISTDLQSDLIKKMTTQATLVEMLDQILVSIEKPLDIDACAIYIVDNIDLDDPSRKIAGIATMRSARGYQRDAIGRAECHFVPSDKVSAQRGPDQKLGLTGWVISTGRSFLAETAKEVFDHPHWSGKYDALQMPGCELRLSTFLAVPIRKHGGRVVGVLKAERLEGKAAFTVENQIVLEAMACVAGRCISYGEYIHARCRNSAVTSWARDIFAEAVATEGELDTFLDIVVKATACATQADACSVFLHDERMKTVTQRAGWGLQGFQKVIRSYKIPDTLELNCALAEICNPETCYLANVKLSEGMKIGVTAWVYMTGKSFCARDKDDLKRHCHHLGNLNSSCGRE
jgi:signal transduction protein with GAF and PtsI domain